jgi:hypothetical protein
VNLKETNESRSIHRKRSFIRSRYAILVVSLFVLLCIASTILFWPITNSAGLLNLVYRQIVVNTSAKATTTILPMETRSPAIGPLKVDPSNPRYFTNGNGKAILLAGSDYWNLWQDGGRTNPPPAFDYNAFIKFALNHGYDYIKSQTWEEARHITDGKYWYIQPTIWSRTGQGTALDGGPKFDLDQLNPDYFNRVRSRVLQAQQNGLYVIVDFFHGFSVTMDKGNITDAWTAHPMNAANNINGVNGDPNQHGDGLDVDTLLIPQITAYQKAYVKHMIDTLNDLDNVIWEIALEPDGTYSYNGHSTYEWEQYMIDYVHSYEATKPKQHPVLYSVPWPGGDNGILMASTAEAISPNDADGYESGDPAPSDGTKVILTNTDHIMWPNGDADWGWKMFTRGMGGIFFMDQSYSTYDDQDGEAGGTYSQNDNFRYNMGWMIEYANRMNLAAMTPRGDLCSTGYCLANPVANGAEYLVYLPAGSTTTAILKDLGMSSQDHKRISSTYLITDSSVTVDLTNTPGRLTVEWFNPSNGETTSGGSVAGGASRNFTAPFTGSAVLYLHASNNISLPFKLFLPGIVK